MICTVERVSRRGMAVIGLAGSLRRVVDHLVGRLLLVKSGQEVSTESAHRTRSARR